MQIFDPKVLGLLKKNNHELKYVAVSTTLLTCGESTLNAPPRIETLIG